MIYQILFSLFIGIVFTRNYDLLCSINTIPTRYHLHCFRSDIRNLSSEYEKCEKFKDLEYFQCVYNIYKLPKEQVDFFSRYDEITLICGGCDYIKRREYLKTYYCSKDQLVEFKSYDQCLKDNTGESADQLNERAICQIDCDIDKGIPQYTNCTYQCEKSIIDKVISFIGKINTITNNSEPSTPSTAPSSNRNNDSMSLYTQPNIYTAILLLLAILL
ncbi:hypothetical protein CONCODRAFT_168909 [Conidiobolus coronatus NRRL 28638]|uniref:Transmembrane protein n=1 Tax=Conidiobolus coronatus (strain ATCC 28846 / CBS 209.66 / NRRL 28638) TaxID=796925 RepID=A0A137PBF1_CONC2|nr:hypothetical protein CONCODRAFT_168909 [Conidiobolus coronatus NRRL 28638]|eukprot:KXN72333.1 hypothetical protein CONCODRAFT_168909 [Conidiobolus coronatus NRRL 28638]